MKMPISLMSCKNILITASAVLLIGCGGGGSSSSQPAQDSSAGSVSTPTPTPEATVEPDNIPTAMPTNAPVEATPAPTPASTAVPIDSAPVSRAPEPARFQIGNAVAPINYWMRAWTLNDVMKTAGFETEEDGIVRTSKMWVPIVNGSWDIPAMHNVDVDAQAWPRSLTLSDNRTADRFVTLLLNSEQADVYEAGTYILTFEGEGQISVEGAEVSSQSQGRMELSFADNGASIFIYIDETDPQGTGNYLRNFSLTRPSAVAGERFNRTYLDFIEPFSIIRPLHMTGDDIVYGTNVRWQDRKQVNYSHWGGAGGAPWEVMVDLANQSNSDLWINVPISADDTYIRNLAELILQNLNPDRALYFELGNEVWNFSLPYIFGHNYAFEQAQLRWPGVLNTITNYSDGDPVNQLMMVFSWQAARTVEIQAIFDDVWGAQSERIVAVLAGQVGASEPFFNNNRTLLEAPVYVGEENATPPAQLVDALAIAPYIGDPYQVGEEESPNGFDRSSPEAFIAEALNWVNGTGRFTAGAQEPGLRFSVRSDRALASEFNLPLIAYEGGQHFIGSAFTRDQIPYHEDMYGLYRAMFDMWQEEGGGAFVHFHGIFPRGQNEPGQEPGFFESENFGIKETQRQTEAEVPRLRALMDEMRELGQTQ